MNEFNIKFGKTYDKSVLLDWLFNNAKKALNDEDIPKFIYSQSKTGNDIKGETKNYISKLKRVWYKSLTLNIKSEQNELSDIQNSILFAFFLIYRF